MKNTFYDIAKLKKNIFLFLIAGSINTIITIVVYQLLLFIVSSSISYCVSWCVGVILVSVVYPYFVFSVKKENHSKTSIQFAIIYIICFFLGLACNQILIFIFNIPRLSIFFTLCFTSSISFLLMHFAASHSYENKY